MLIMNLQVCKLWLLELIEIICTENTPQSIAAGIIYFYKQV